MEKNTKFKIITFIPVLKKGIPGTKAKIQNIKNDIELEKTLSEIQKSTVLQFEVIDVENNTNTLYHRILGSKNFSKKTRQL